MITIYSYLYYVYVRTCYKYPDPNETLEYRERYS